MPGISGSCACCTPSVPQAGMAGTQVLCVRGPMRGRQPLTVLDAAQHIPVLKAGGQSARHLQRESDEGG